MWIEHHLFCYRFVPDKEFSGSDRRQRGREGPVQFEEDPFGLDKFLEEAKQHGGSKRPSDSSRPKEHEHEGKKRRKEWMDWPNWVPTLHYNPGLHVHDIFNLSAGVYSGWSRMKQFSSSVQCRQMCIILTRTATHGEQGKGRLLWTIQRHVIFMQGLSFDSRVPSQHSQELCPSISW